jgi:serine/threonine protein kinase
MTERMIGPYRVLDKLGEGGMGEVYRAHDSRLGRDLAIKVLPAAMASDPDMRERFGREARAIAALNHPNIVTIYSVEDADGVRFLTMELVEGEALDRLIPSGGLDIDRVISIGEAVADALAAAHDRGIIHRDLKPANVMVTKDGRVKVLDFGLAKVHGPDAGDGTRAELPTAMVTAAGMVMGTRPYMSPEQVQGRALDRRTDIFSLGVMLYEMTTGRRPFQGQSPAELFASILRDPAPLASDLRADLPSDLARVIQRCLEKDPNDRMQTARDAGHALRDSTRSARASSEQPRPSSGRTRAAVQVLGPRRRADDAGRGPVGRDRHRLVAVLVSPGDCP